MNVLPVAFTCLWCTGKTCLSADREKVQQGYVIKIGPGYAIPMPMDDEPWKNEEDLVKYVPLQTKAGDLAIFLLSGATKVMYEGDKYFIVPQSAILMLKREEDL